MTLRYTAACVAALIIGGGAAEARAAKKSSATTTYTSYATKAYGGCYKAAPTTDCGHEPAASKSGGLGGRSSWEPWARLPEAGAVPVTEAGNSYAGGIGYVWHRVPAGTRALDLTAVMQVVTPLSSAATGTGFGAADAYLEFFPAGCSDAGCESELRKPVMRSLGVSAPSSRAAGETETLALTVSAPEGETIPAGYGYLRATLVNFAGGEQIPGTTGLADGTMKLLSLTVTRR